VTVFAVCRELVGSDTPASQQRSTPVIGCVAAAPQCISGRTSYLRVRLAFHRYPQLFRAFCNRHRCGPSRPVTGAAAWPWVAHTVSGLLGATGRASHTRFRSASGCTCLRRRHLGTRRVILQKARDHPGQAQGPAPTALTAWTQSVSGSLSLPSAGCFSPFPHGTLHYRSRTVACLGRWSALLPTRLHVPRGTRDPSHHHAPPRYGTLTRSGAPFQALPGAAHGRLRGRQPPRLVSPPRCRNGCRLGTASVWAAARFARHYSGPATTSCSY
jgi:hypothetical protein